MLSSPCGEGSKTRVHEHIIVEVVVSGSRVGLAVGVEAHVIVEVLAG